MHSCNIQRLWVGPIKTGPAKSRNPRNPPIISQNPHAKKRNPTPATKSIATPPKANYRNPPALDREPRFLNVVAKYMAVEMRFCTDRCGYGIFILIFIF